MLTSRDIEGVLAQVEYRPGWAFTVKGGHPEGTQLNIRAEVEDAYNRGMMVTLSIDTFIPPCPRPRDFLRWLAWRLERIEIHESQEWFRWRGQIVRDPHTTWAQ